MKEDIKSIAKLLIPGSNILVTSHMNPDGDAIGSVLALYEFLRNRGLTASIIVPNQYPGFLKWMDKEGVVRIYSENRKICNISIRKADLIFCLDYNALARIGDMSKPILSSKAKRILIDHHPGPSNEFDYVISTVETSSTAELVYDFMFHTGGKDSITLPIAEALYVGIMTDTGSFSYNANFVHTYEVVSHLMQVGIDGEAIHRLVYDTYSEDRMRLLGHCLTNKLTIIPEIKTAYIALTKEELEKYNYQIGDTEGVVNYALAIEGIMIAVLLTERSDHIRLSFRSKGNFAVNKIAFEHFEGGGHKNAAGGNSFVSMDETINILLKVLHAIQIEVNES